jgi:hypothetical protein
MPITSGMSSLPPAGPAAESRTVQTLELPREHPLLGGAAQGILFSNAVTLAGAVFQHWPALPVLAIYWGQSVAIGAINVIRMLSLREFSTDGFRSGNRPVPANRQGQVSTAKFFALHYGAFHFVYAMFLFGSGRLGDLTGPMAWMVAGNVAMFATSHAWPLIASGGQDYRGKPNLGVLMFYPYLRILPMHLAIILGAAFSGALPLFIVLKTGADLGMHAVEHRIFRSAD